MIRRKYPFHPGHSADDTSIAAAADLAPRQRSVQGAALAVIAEAGPIGATSDEIAHQLGLERWAARPRAAELRKRGAIIDSGQRRVNLASGKPAIVWIIPEHGDVAK